MEKLPRGATASMQRDWKGSRRIFIFLGPGAVMVRVRCSVLIDLDDGDDGDDRDGSDGHRDLRRELESAGVGRPTPRVHFDISLSEAAALWRTSTMLLQSRRDLRRRRPTIESS